MIDLSGIETKTTGDVMEEAVTKLRCIGETRLEVLQNLEHR